MPTTVNDVTEKTETLEIDPKSSIAVKPTMKDDGGETAPKSADNEQEDEKQKQCENKSEQKEEEKIVQEAQNKQMKEKEVPVEVEPKTGISFPVMSNDGKLLKAVGLRKKSMLGLGIKIYAFGIYADSEKLKDQLRKIGKAPSKPTKEMYQMVIDSDVGMTVRLVIAYFGLTMSMVRKNFDEGLGASIKKITGGKNEELTKKIMGEASDDIKLTPGSVIEISRLPGYILQTKVKDEIVSTVESELLCRAYIFMYLGEDPFDKEAKEKFGASLLTLF